MSSTLYTLLDRLYGARDLARIRRTRNIRLIPLEVNRRGGKVSFAEWAHVIGIFQTLMFQHTERSDDFAVLDVGCGTGLLGIAAEPLLGERGSYTGLDVMTKDIEFCRGHYPAPRYQFIHFDLNNPAYAPEQRKGHQPWPLEGGRFDLVTALSVWTHLDESDALFYLTEVARVLKPGGTALITGFILDDEYTASLEQRSDSLGRYHQTRQSMWIFDQPAYESKEWFHPKWVKVPEQAIGIKSCGLERMLSNAALGLAKFYPGNWKEKPGIYFQDVMVLRKLANR